MSTASPYITSNLKKLTPEDLAIETQDWKNARIADNTHRRRGIRNMMAYVGLDEGQWTRTMRANLKRDGRDPKTYNFIQMISRGHIGNQLMNAVDPKLLDREGDGVDTQEALDGMQKAYYANKEQYDYKASGISCFENGLAYRGVEELVIDRPSSNPRKWGIKFESLRPDLVILDPANLTDDISRKAKEAWKMSMLTPEQMLRHFDSKSDDILRAMVSEDELRSRQFEELSLDMFDDIEGRKKMGNKHLCVEHLHLKEEKCVIEMAINPLTGEFLEIPKTDCKLDSPEDIAQKQQWAVNQGFMLSDLGGIESVLLGDHGLPRVKPIRKVDYKPILWLTTFCPDLGILLENRRDERQLDGHLPLYAWSFIQKWGISIGLADLLFDPQDDLNKREMAKSKVITQSLLNSKMWMSEDIIPDGSDKTLEEYTDQANDVSKPFITPSGMKGDSLFGVVSGGQVNQAIFQDIGEKADFLNRIGSLPPAMQGFAGNSAESGVAVGRRVIEGSIMNRLPMETWLQHENYKATDWFLMARKLYSGKHNVNRTFQGGDAEPVELNKIVGYYPDNSPILKNDVSKITRPEVLVLQSKENDYLKQAQREMDVAALQAIPPSPQSDPIRAAFECSLASRMDHTDDEEKEQVLKACKKRIDLANIQADVAIKAAELSLKNITAELNAAPAPPGGPGPTPMPPGGPPPEGPPLEGPPPEGPPAGAPTPEVEPLAV